MVAMVKSIINFNFFSFKVRNIVNRCTCYDRFPIKKLSEGKYQFGEQKTLIFVRVKTVRSFVGFLYKNKPRKQGRKAFVNQSVILGRC